MLSPRAVPATLSSLVELLLSRHQSLLHAIEAKHRGATAPLGNGIPWRLLPGLRQDEKNSDTRPLIFFLSFEAELPDLTLKNVGNTQFIYPMFINSKPMLLNTE